MLRMRLVFGTIMVLFFGGVMLIDGLLDGTIMPGSAHDTVRGTLTAVLVMLVVGISQVEMERLLASTGVKVFRPIVMTSSVMLAVSWYLKELFPTMSLGLYIAYVTAFAFMAIMLFQAQKHGVRNVVANCGGNLFAVLYAGLFGAFFIGVRTQFGVWPLMMLVFTVKSCDIGAYAAGRLFGSHKFAPEISPGKTWEGMAGGAFLAVIIGSIFASRTHLMSVFDGALFGFAFAFIGQMGDLAESMLKRDARLKDSSHSVPGFGGVLDVIDSPLFASPFAMLFFTYFAGIKG
jgi:phosphatidate cytidylyltransferase